jgi:hypothetical protein
MNETEYGELGNDMDRGTLKYSQKICPTDTFFTINSTNTVVGWNLGLRRDRLFTNHVSHGETDKL